METFFWRDLEIYRARYQELVRVETIEFDPLVNRYFEAEFSGETSNSLSETDSFSSEGSNSATTAGTNRNDGFTSGTTTTEGTNSSTTVGEASGTSNSTTTTSDTNTISGRTDESHNIQGTSMVKSADKQAPMDASNGASPGGGVLPTFNFTHATSIAQTDGKNSDIGTSNTTNSSTTTSSGTTGVVGATTDDTSTEVNGENESTTSSSYTTQNTGSSNTTVTSSDESESTNTKSQSGASSVLNRNRYTGREGLTPTQAMAIASDYLMNYSTAFKWLVRNLEKNFISIYDY